MRKNSGTNALAMRVAIVGACLAIDGLTAEAANRLRKNDRCRAAISATNPAIVRQSASKVIETANFRIDGLRRPTDAARCAQRLETLRTALQQRWLGSAKPGDWSPTCVVVVHATLQSYIRRAGAEAAATLGASRIELDHGRVATRRIDVRADQPGGFDAVVPHELSHIVLAVEFPGGTLPAWADEGMAVMADSPAKQALHLRDYHTTRAGRVSGTLAGFMTQTGYPGCKEMPAFYGRSVSLVRFLVDRKSPADFVRFLHCAETQGYDAALRDCYGIDGAADLERQWK